MNDVQDVRADDGDLALSFVDVWRTLASQWKWLVSLPLAAGLVSVAVTQFIPPTFTAVTVVMPPQGQGGAASALSSLGNLSGLAALSGSVGRSSGDQYVSLLQSATVTQSIVDRFGLMSVYGVKYRIDARQKLAGNVRVSLGKRDGLISIEVDDKNPQRAADIANRFVEELRTVTSSLAVTEAQQRRAFFEQQLTSARDALVQAQRSLQGSGFNAGALKAEPKAAAEDYARIRAELTAAEVRLQVSRSALADNTPEVRQQQSRVTALREQLARLESTSKPVSDDIDYIGRYREFKYRETLFELYARQFEIARVDESREGALIQVVDKATQPEVKSYPKRGLTAVVTTAIAMVLVAVGLLIRRGRRG